MPDVNQHTILIVEDDTSIRESIVDMLEINGFEVISTENGKAGWDSIVKSSPSLILSDLMMPVMNGYELLEKVRKNSSTELIPFIMVTAKVDIESKLHGLELGADDYITKPFEFKELMLKITNLVEIRTKVMQRFHIDPGQLNLDSEEKVFMNKLRFILEEHIDQSDISIDFLCDHLYVSSATLNRKIKKITGKSPNVVIKEFRLKRAKDMIQLNYGSLSEIAAKTGFNSLSYFSSSYKDFFGCSPNEHLK